MVEFYNLYDIFEFKQGIVLHKQCNSKIFWKNFEYNKQS